jgi:hypothetical protein
VGAAIVKAGDQHGKQSGQHGAEQDGTVELLTFFGVGAAFHTLLDA